MPRKPRKKSDRAKREEKRRSMRERRKDPEIRNRENEERRWRREEERANDKKRQQENARRKQLLAEERAANPAKRQEKNSRRAAEQQVFRSVPENNERDKEIRRRDNESARQQEQYRTPERIQDRLSHAAARRLSKRRLNLDDGNPSTPKRRRMVWEDSFQARLKHFNLLVSEGPTHICSCCGSLLYAFSVQPASREKLLKWGCSDEVINKVLHVVQEKHFFCHTCSTNIRKSKKPPHVALCDSGLDFTEIPPELKGMTRLEERLVASRLPFMQIQLKGYEQQWTIKESIVNVENNVDLCVSSVPRNFNQAGVVQVELMRRMAYRQPYIRNKIRPAKVMSAARYLKESPLYKKHNVTINENWNTFESDDVDFIVNPSEETTSENQEPNEKEDDTNDRENDEDSNPPIQETLIFNDDDFSSHGIRISPAEENTPLLLTKDMDAERLSFPSIYCGQLPKEPVALGRRKLSYTDIAKSELRRYDRRAAKPEKVLYSFRKSFKEKVWDAYNICLRQTKGSRHRYVARDLWSVDGISKIIAKDNGFAVYKGVRSTPAFWKEQLKRVVAMVRQLGTCTFFVTLSAAETKWTDLLVILAKLQNGITITEQQAAQLSFKEKAHLIHSDPVTCMRHFDFKYKMLLRELFKKEVGVFEPHKIGDYYSRVEFQMRGPPHSHGLYWIPTAPMYNAASPDSIRECIEFIENYITCRRDAGGELDTYIGYQIHIHSDTCKKGENKRNCRFHFPRPPLPATMILKALPPSTPDNEKEDLMKIFKKIQEKLNDWGPKFRDDIGFNDFLESLQLDQDTYIKAIRSNLERDTVFLKRKTCDIFVNNYNERLLLAWKANMDIQFVLDPYACAKYCASYIVKSDPGVSKLLESILADARKKSQSAVDCVEEFGKVLLTRTEISAQEAASCILGLPSTFCSRADMYINTAEPNNRVKMLKSQEELKNLFDNSTDICQKGLLDRYEQRPEDLEDTCLAEFGSLYEFSAKKKRNVTDYSSLSNEGNFKTY